MTDEPEIVILQAARTIRSELAELLPEESPSFGADLDVMIANASSLQGESLSELVDVIIAYLSSRDETRQRLAELAEPVDVVRGVDVWAPDILLPGEDTDEDLVPVVCLTCHYENHLAYRPPAGEPMPTCQNPVPPSHQLRLT